VSPDEYRRFSERLRERVAADERALGLVAVGSMAALDYQPDEWSDHDFFVVTAPGAQEELRVDTSWLPDTDRIVFWHRETDHGLQVFYDDGHLLEFAVFDLDELALAGVNRYRVLLDRGGVEERMAAVRAQSQERPRPDDTHQFGKFLACLQVGAGRARRGEELSGAMFVKDLAVRFLVVLLTRAVPAENASLLDDLDPLRRFDFVHPQLAGELVDLGRQDTVAAALGLLDVAERELRPRRPDLPWQLADVIRRHALAL
jgi:hypothetical protein